MKIRYRIAVFTMAMMMVIGLYGNTAQAAVEDNTLVVGFDAEFPPYGYMDDNGEYVGFDLSLAEEVCKRRGWTLVKQPIDWDSKDLELTAGNIDCIWNGFTINGRESQYTWSVPYVDNSQVVVVKVDSDIKELNDLKDKVVAVQADSSALAAFTGEGATEENIELCASFEELQQVSDYNSAFMNLEIGMVDAICMDIGVAKYQVESRGNEFILLEEQVSSEAYGIGFELGNTELKDLVEESLNEMVEDGTFDAIAAEWGLSDCVCLKESFENQKGEVTQNTVTDNKDQMVQNIVANDEDIVEIENKEAVDSKVDLKWIVSQLGKGMLATIIIFVLTLVFSMPLGLLITYMRMSKVLFIQGIAKLYISVMRGTPLMLQLLVVFFGPGYLFDDIDLPKDYRFYAVIIGFSMNYAAYFAEIYRSGIQSIPVGQREAAQVLGYSKRQTFFKIIFPQMVKRVMPAVTNEVITLVKDTSLAFAIAYTEMFTLAKQIAAKSTSVLPLFIAGIFYYIFNFLVAFIMERIEKKLDYYK